MISKLYSGVLYRCLSAAPKKSVPKGRIEKMPAEGKSRINIYAYATVCSAILVVFAHKLYVLHKSEDKEDRITAPAPKAVLDSGTQYIKNSYN